MSAVDDQTLQQNISRICSHKMSALKKDNSQHFIAEKTEQVINGKLFF